MLKRHTGITLVTLVLVLLALTGAAQAQGPEPLKVEVTQPDGPVGPAQPEGPLEVAGVDAALNDAIPFQGRLTTPSGAAVSGSLSIRMRLYDVSSGGTALCDDTDTVDVVNGLFVFDMDFCDETDITGKQLYLGITVGADAEMTPRQELLPVVYARTLRPGAIIDQTATAKHALEVQSAGTGESSAALSATNTDTTATGGIAVLATSTGGDAAIVAHNGGTGQLFKGYGNDGGDDEFRINNNGAIETRADSYIFVPGNVLIKNLNSDTTRWDIQSNGAARIFRGATAGSKTVYFPITLPTHLYGQPVKVEAITVYYVCLDGTKGFIEGTYLRKQADADSYVELITDVTSRTGTTATSYTLSPTADNVLSTYEGLGFRLELSFADDTNWVQIGGIRIRLGHHDLY